LKAVALTCAAFELSEADTTEARCASDDDDDDDWKALMVHCQG
jgi:hypothetical protein